MLILITSSLKIGSDYQTREIDYRLSVVIIYAVTFVIILCCNKYSQSEYKKFVVYSTYYTQPFRGAPCVPVCHIGCVGNYNNNFVMF